jgi:hypothetical protein
MRSHAKVLKHYPDLWTFGFISLYKVAVQIGQ